MSKTAVHTNLAPEPVGPYSQGIVTDSPKFFFSAGQIGFDPKTNALVNSDFNSQAEQALKNVEAILLAAGFSLDDVVKVTVYVKNMDDFTAFNEIYINFFQQIPPARSVVEVSALPKNALLEIECIACLTS